MAGNSIALVAGEKSGDILASSLLRGLKAHGYFGDEVRAAGIGGDAMAAEGFINWWHIDALSLRGYAEVLPALPRLLWMRRQLRQRILRERPSLFVGVDAPDFNLSLEASLRARGQRVVHFISPSIWAWRRERIEKIRRAVDHMLLVFPFEAQIYQDAKIAATYVGHPLADEIPLQLDRTAIRRRLGLDPRAPVIALLPGSRPDEIRYMAQNFLQTAKWLHERERDLQFLVPAANAAIKLSLQQMCAALPASLVQRLRLLDGQAHDALAACDTALIASGTATLEALFFHRPMVITYKMSPTSYKVMKGKGYLPFIGLPNILCNEFAVPELVQDQASPASLGAALLAQLHDPRLQSDLAERFEAIHQSMRLGCAQRAAQVLHDLRKV